MRVIESCAACLYRKQTKLTDNAAYLKEIKDIIDNRADDDCAPYLAARFNDVYERYFGTRRDYTVEKKRYNDLVLSMENAIRARIAAADDPLAAALLYARIGNYIDFSALSHVEESTFLGLFDGAALSEADQKTIRAFAAECAAAKSFLLITDNCGEIVLDKLLIEQLQKQFPGLSCTVLVRGQNVVNDATLEDAAYVGIDRVARVIPNGIAAAGTIYKLLSPEARAAVDGADVILAKGQGNYESLAGQGRHVFYAFLCKCELFTTRFGVPSLTGIFLEER